MTIRAKTGAAALILAAVAAAGAVAQSDAEAAALRARQSHMQLQATNLGPLGLMAQGRMEYDADLASAAASNLAAVAALNQFAYWPEGTDIESIENTRALPAIWEDMEGFMAVRDELAAASATLAEEAGGGLEALQAALGPVAAACGGCHEDYRQED